METANSFLSLRHLVRSAGSGTLHADDVPIPTRTIKTLLSYSHHADGSSEAAGDPVDFVEARAPLAQRLDDSVADAHEQGRNAATQNPYRGGSDGSVAVVGGANPGADPLQTNLAEATARLGDHLDLSATRFAVGASVTGLPGGADDTLGVAQDISAVSVGGMHREKIGDATLLVGGDASTAMGLHGLSASIGATVGATTILPSITAAVVTHHSVVPQEERQLNGKTIEQLVAIKTGVQPVFVVSLQATEAKGVGGGVRLALSRSKNVVYHRFLPVAEVGRELAKQSAWYSFIREPLCALGIVQGLATAPTQKFLAGDDNFKTELQVGESVTWETSRRLTFGANIGGAGVRAGAVISAGHGHRLRLERSSDAVMLLRVESGQTTQVAGHAEAALVVSGHVSAVAAAGISREFSFDLREKDACEDLRRALEGHFPADLSEVAQNGGHNGRERALLGLGMGQRLRKGVANVSLERAEQQSQELALSGLQPLAIVPTVAGLSEHRTRFQRQSILAKPQQGVALTDSSVGVQARRSRLWRGRSETLAEGTSHAVASLSKQGELQRSFGGVTIKLSYDFTKPRPGDMRTVAREIEQAIGVAVVAPPVVAVKKSWQLTLTRTLSSDHLNQLAEANAEQISLAAEAVNLPGEVVSGWVGGLQDAEGSDDQAVSLTRAASVSGFVTRYQSQGFGVIQRIIDGDEPQRGVRTLLKSDAVDRALEGFDDWRLRDIAAGSVAASKRSLNRLDKTVIPLVEKARMANDNDTILRVLDPRQAQNIAHGLGLVRHLAGRERDGLRRSIDGKEPGRGALSRAIRSGWEKTKSRR